MPVLVQVEKGSAGVITLRILDAQRVSDEQHVMPISLNCSLKSLFFGTNCSSVHHEGETLLELNLVIVDYIIVSEG